MKYFIYSSICGKHLSYISLNAGMLSEIEMVRDFSEIQTCSPTVTCKALDQFIFFIDCDVCISSCGANLLAVSFHWIFFDNGQFCVFCLEFFPLPQFCKRLKSAFLDSHFALFGWERQWRLFLRLFLRISDYNYTCVSSGILIWK